VRWLVDECVDYELVERLRAAGHDVSYVLEITPRARDAEVIGRADAENRLLLTEDKDFGELVFHQARRVPGIVLLRINPSMRSLKWARIQSAIASFGASLLGRYTVIEEARMRSRSLWPPP
jgi:predicted nuclease of predicted toxin-antitoxin system